LLEYSKGRFKENEWASKRRRKLENKKKQGGTGYIMGVQGVL